MKRKEVKEQVKWDMKGNLSDESIKSRLVKTGFSDEEADDLINEARVELTIPGEHINYEEEHKKPKVKKEGGTIELSDAVNIKLSLDYEFSEIFVFILYVFLAILLIGFILFLIGFILSFFGIAFVVNLIPKLIGFG